MPRSPTIDPPKRTEAVSSRSKSSKPIHRLDPPHLPARRLNNAYNQALHKSARSIRDSITFALLILLVGQVFLIGGFFAEQFAICGIGGLLSVGGVFLALLSVVDGFKQMEMRMEALEAKSSPAVKKRSRLKSKRKTL